MPQRRVLITGAGSGLGRGLALRYARAGKLGFHAAREIDDVRYFEDEGGRVRRRTAER